MDHDDVPASAVQRVRGDRGCERIHRIIRSRNELITESASRMHTPLRRKRRWGEELASLALLGLKDVSPVGIRWTMLQRPAALSNADAVCGTVLVIGRLTKSALSDEVVQDDQARRFAEPEEPCGLMQVQRQAWHLLIGAKD